MDREERIQTLRLRLNQLPLLVEWSHKGATYLYEVVASRNGRGIALRKASENLQRLWDKHQRTF